MNLLSGMGLLLAMLPADAAVDAGAAIYRDGVSPRGVPIAATVGGESVPAAVLPCLNCHGADGRGKREGGVSAADITPGALSRPLHTERRQRPAYDSAAQLRRAITLGSDAGRQPLDPAMPRYALSLADAEDLLAYLKQLEQRNESGVDDETLRISVLDMPDLQEPETKIYGRRVQLLREHNADVLLRIDASADGSESLRAAERERIPTLVFDAGDAVPGEFGFAVTAAPAQQRQLLQTLLDSTADAQLLTQGCTERDGVSNARVLVLTAAAAAACDLSGVSASAHPRILVALPAPPDANVRRAAMAQALSWVTQILASLGRDVTREALRDQLQRIQARPLGLLPPVTWSAQRRHGLDAIWVMTLNEARDQLTPVPGWVGEN